MFELRVFDGDRMFSRSSPRGTGVLDRIVLAGDQDIVAIEKKRGFMSVGLRDLVTVVFKGDGRRRAEARAVPDS